MTEISDPTLAAVFALPGRSTRAVIDLEAIAANVRALRTAVAQPTGLMAVVKAVGYGHGAVMVSRCALANGASVLGVATVSEAADLRKHQVASPIVLLGPCDPSEVERALMLDVDLTVASQTLIDAIARSASALGKTARVHLKIDTGMHRFGTNTREALALVDRFETLENVDLVGVSTHFAAADKIEHPANVHQSAIFEQAVAQVRARLGRFVGAHSANSAAALRGMAVGTEFARCGISVYGFAPGADIPLPEGMRPAMSLVSRLARVHDSDVGSGVSYGHRYVSDHVERFGLIPVGYADGYRRSLSNMADVQIGESRCPVRGVVTMDQVVAGDLPNSAKEGDLVGIGGPLGGGPGVDALAALAGTIPYEMVSGIGCRVPRYYVASERVVATLIEGQLETI
jgi:alanine racemase